MLENLNSISIVKQLQDLANQDKYVPNFFPTSLAKAGTVSVLENIPIDDLYRILKKLNGRQRGPWLKFNKRVEMLVEFDFN